MVTRILAVIVLVQTAVIVWVFGAGMSSDAIGLAVGVMMGATVGIPTALLVAARYERRHDLPATPPTVLPTSTSLVCRNGTEVMRR